MTKMKKIQNRIVAIKDHGAKLEKEIREKTLGYIVTSFGLVAGLAWNDAIKSMIEEFFPLHKDTVKAKTVYAVVITAIVVLVSIYLSRLFKKETVTQKKEEKE
jgi:hypothetical protein